MAWSYLLGNLLGRALISYALVWLVCWLCSRFDWRAASRRSRRWYSLLGVLVLTVGGLGAALVGHGGIH